MIARTALSGLVCIAAVARAQTTANAGRDRFVADARAGTAQYQNVSMAIADGFKRVGVEFPAMGEHWVSLSRVLENRFDARRPSVLINITTRGTRQLAGGGYTALLGDGDQPPRTAATAADWHEHNGSVIDESLPVHGHDHKHSDLAPEAAALGATRLAILHVWAWANNPAGTFVTENWSLPLTRRGMSPRKLRAATVRALSLANDSASYYEQTLRTSLGLSAVESQRVHAILDARRADARAELKKRPILDEDALGRIWTSLWTDLDTKLPGRTSDLRAIRAKL